jgi:uncharacterized protein
MDQNMPRLNDAEARVLGVLIEKSLTTPNGYPLSLNSAVNGCNQKSNRDPQTSFVEAEVVVALQGLVPKGLAGRVMRAGSRVESFRHTAHAGLGLEDGELAILAELLLRGPQAQGQLRARVDRMSPTPTLEELRARLDGLVTAGFVARVAPPPGTRAEHFVQLLAPDLHAPGAAAKPELFAALASSASLDSGEPAESEGPAPPALEERMQRLETKVEEMGAKLDGLLAQLGE